MSAEPTPAVTTVEALIRHRLSSALGGVRGSLETTAPMLVFVVAWSLTTQARLALGLAGAVVAVLALARVLQRQTLQFVGSSVIATAIAAFFALRTGRAEDAFLPGILMSAGWAVASLVSVLARWPLVGFMVGAADPAAKEGDPFRWRRNDAALRVCTRLTLVLTGLYVIRVAVMGPLYLADQLAALTVAKIVLGWPLWAAAVAVMGGLLLRGRTPIDPDDAFVRDHLAAAQTRGQGS